MISETRKAELESEYSSYLEEYEFIKKIKPDYFPDNIHAVLLHLKLQEVINTLGDLQDAVGQKR